MWCELQKSPIADFNLYMVWRTLFSCLEEAPLSNYGNFERAHATEITAQRHYYSLDYVDVWGSGVEVTSSSIMASLSIKEKEKEGKLEGDDAKSEGYKSSTKPPPFNPMIYFFM